MLDFSRSLFTPVHFRNGGGQPGWCGHRRASQPLLSELMLATVRLKIVGRVRKIYEQLNNTKKKLKKRCV